MQPAEPMALCTKRLLSAGCHGTASVAHASRQACVECGGTPHSLRRHQRKLMRSPLASVRPRVIQLRHAVLRSSLTGQVHVCSSTSA